MRRIITLHEVLEHLQSTTLQSQKNWISYNCLHKFSKTKQRKCIYSTCTCSTIAIANRQNAMGEQQHCLSANQSWHWPTHYVYLNRLLLISGQSSTADNGRAMYKWLFAFAHYLCPSSRPSLVLHVCITMLECLLCRKCRRNLVFCGKPIVIIMLWKMLWTDQMNRTALAYIYSKYYILILTDIMYIQ